jgi:hypothetical protein
MKGKCWVFSRADHNDKMRKLGEKLGSAFNEEDCYWYTFFLFFLKVGEIQQRFFPTSVRIVATVPALN